MTILLPVISRLVDHVILDYLSQIQYEELTSTIDGDLNQNNKNSTDENNNNQVEYDYIGGLVGDWAAEPWTSCDDVDVPDWAKLQGPNFEKILDIEEDLVWAEDPWTQTPLINIPVWMILPGIDVGIQEEASIDNILESNEDKISEVQENDDEFLDPCVEVKDWSEEKYEQLPLDVPRWALLPGIDFPVRYGNSPYWEYNIERRLRYRIRFGKKIFTRNLPTLLEEKLVYNNDAKSILYVPTRYGRVWYRY